MAVKEFPSVYQYLLDVRERYGAGFLVLFDPDRMSLEQSVNYAIRCRDAGVHALLIGTSLMMGNGFSEYVEAIHDAVDIPVIIFPGEKAQVTDKADAILFLSLLSGRNPEYIIGEQVRSAPLVRNLGIEAISTAYLLIESGKSTSVEFMSNTRPIPSDKPDIVVAHALAAEIFGMKFIYLEAGSGAERSVPDEIIRAVVKDVRVPLIVGGGIRTSEEITNKVNAGASFIVVGNHVENNINQVDLRAFVQAARKS